MALVDPNGGVIPNVQPPPPAFTVPTPYGQAPGQQYVTPTQNEANFHQQFQGVDPMIANQAMNQARLAYARAQLAKYQRVARLVGGDYLNTINNAGSDPLARFHAAASAFTGFARNAGYADPRMYLSHLLALSRQHGVAQP